jgi:hypothetical protein
VAVAEGDIGWQAGLARVNENSDDCPAQQSASGEAAMKPWRGLDQSAAEAGGRRASVPGHVPGIIAGY